MEQQRDIYNPIMIFILTIVSIHIASSSSQNLHIVTTTIDIGSTDGDKITDRAWLHPLNTTTSSTYQDFTTDLPTSTSAEAEEILDSSETIVLNRYARPFQHNGYGRQELDKPDEPPDHVIPYSEHEEARDVPTQPKYVGPGTWAKPPPDKNISLDFVPTKLHAQVRGKHTVKRLPQREAIDSAETNEEKRNAARLREVVTNSKVNTVYTEEGYEDSAYDHAGHIRDADFHEGFARKLHDRMKKGENSLSDQKKNLEPDGFKEYEEDYQDHLQENRKFETDDGGNLIEFGRGSWEESETDPKFVAENNIQKLEEDIEKDAEEAEKSAKIYENEQESKVRNDIKTDSSELEESHDNLKHKNKFIKTKKKKKSKLQNGKDGSVTKKSKQSHKLKQKKKLYSENYRTTVLPFKEADLSDVEKPARPYGFVTSSPNSQIYSVDQTTLRYVSPFDTTASFLQVEDEPTTIGYRDLFWDYFKARQGPSTTESTLVLNSTTMNPQQEARTPIAVATIDGHGPYLLVTKEESVTLRPTFFDPSSFRPRNLFSDHVEFGPTSAQTHSRHLLGQSGDVSYANNGITTSTVASAFASVQPLSLLNPENVAYSSSTTLIDATVSSSTPTVMTVNFTQEAYAQIADYHENPFLGPVLDNSNIVVAKNKLKYKVLARAKPSSREKKPVKSVAQQSFRQQTSPSSSKEEDEYKNIRDKLNAKYNKMLSYIKNKQETVSFPREKKIGFPEDFTLRRPPIQQASYSIFLTDHPSPTNRSSVSAESESSRETNRRSPLQNQHRSEPVKLPFRFNSVSHVQPLRPVHHKNSLPTTKLSPPPLPLASTYANYRSNKKSDNRHSHVSGKPQKKRDNAFKHLSLSPEASWRTRSRRKRSDVSEFRDGSSNGAGIDVKAATNNGVTNDDKSEQQNKSLFDRVIDRSEGKSSSPKVIDAPIDVPNAMKLAFPARPRGDESGTSRNKSSSIGERKNIEDARKTIGIPEIIEKGQIVMHSARQNVRMNDTEIAELAKKKRDIGSERSTRNLKNEINEKSHEELLNESPKISGDVIDEEIAVRFNEKDNEASPKKNGKIEIEVPSFDYVDELAEDELIKPSTTTEAAIDLKKYPFYNHDDIPNVSALKYVVDPETVPRKTSRGMEFYDSRNAYKQCDEVEPNLDKVLPEKEEPDPERGPQQNLPRLRGLGDKLDCFKAKYFDENPLDNPLFGEKLVEEPTLPTELNPTKFASKIMVLPEENDDYVVPQVSKKPERSSRQWRNRIRPYETLESIRVNYKNDPQTGRGRNAYFHSMRGTRLTNMMRRVKNRKHRPKISTTTSVPKFQTSSYQNLVYEDVMGNIRNMKNTYQVYEMTTLPPSSILITAGSENMLKVVDVASNSSNERSTSKPEVIDLTDVANNTKITKSSEIKGLLPPPKYLIQRQSYRKPRPPAKSRGSLLRSTTFPRIIAHHHTIKLNKRSITDDAEKNSSEITISENKKTTINGESVKVDVGNDVIVKVTEKAMNKTNATAELLDLEIEESRPISTLDGSLFTTLKMDDKKKRRNSTSSGVRSEPQKTVYTIRDRIRYSKPKWDTRGFGKFTTSSKTDEDSRRKEPRYNRIERKKKLVDDRQNNSTIMNSTESTSGIESAKSLTGDRESSTTEVYHAEESAIQQMIYHKKDEYSEPENVENIDADSEESFFKEDTEESTTSTYQVSEEVDENVATTMATANSPSTKAVLDLREYLKSDPPGYAEAFPEEATTPLSKHHESDDSEEKQEEETDHFGNVANPRDNDSSEKIEEQVETPTETNLFSQDDDSEEHLSKEEEDSNKDQTFFAYPKRPSLTEDDDNDEKAAFYKPFPFSRFKSAIKKGSEENNSNEESEEKSETYVFPWHLDKEYPEDKRQWLYDVGRYEYPWERRDRLARERRKRRQNRARFFDDEDEEESRRYERPIYSWERYNVPSKRLKVGHGISRRYVDESGEDSSTEQVPLTKFSSRYSSGDIKPQFSNAREISRSIKKFLEEDDKPEGKTSKEIESRSPSYARKSLPSSDRGISRGTLVPEDITQPPGRKNVRRKVSRVDKNVSTNSRFDSKKLRSEDVDGKKEEEAAGYLKLNRSSLDEPIEVTSSQPSQLSNGTKEVPSTTEQRKKRRRISRNNSTISLDNASAESIAKLKKRRRKPDASTTTSTTPSASIDFSPRKSAFTPVRRKYLKKDEKTSRSNFSEKTAADKTISTPATTKTDNSQVETSTPKTRTIEHRSTVSKEKIVTKTTYPDEAKNFDSMKTNPTSAQSRPVQLRMKSRRRKNNNTRDGNNEDSNDRKELIKQEDKNGNYEVKFANEDEIKKSVISDKPQDGSRGNAVGRFGMKREEVKKINDFGSNEGIVNNENDNGNGGFGISSEIYAVRNLMQNIPPNQNKNQANERTESHRITENKKDQNNDKANEEGEEEEEDLSQKQKPLLQAKFIKDPERRLYYYVERK
ncbi:uncharacterized protein LOC120358057 [Solenopsis invicta]|uniref:uncharacterized protein LOC120358057 n=1 Tax=Solenopsis invicta TaxID=13686 RepID=UPI00193DB9C1|nr:uncharacterized protein LOC120358057 [Solenopsis invicta]